MSDIVQFPKDSRMKVPPPTPAKRDAPAPVPPQLLFDRRRFDAWWNGPGDTKSRHLGAYSLYELRAYTGIPCTRLPDVLRRSGMQWLRAWDRVTRVHLWTSNLQHPLLRGNDDYE